jgi:hypothetical protein
MKKIVLVVVVMSCSVAFATPIHFMDVGTTGIAGTYNLEGSEFIDPGFGLCEPAFNYPVSNLSMSPPEIINGDCLYGQNSNIFNTDCSTWDHSNSFIPSCAIESLSYFCWDFNPDCGCISHHCTIPAPGAVILVAIGSIAVSFMRRRKIIS